VDIDPFEIFRSFMSGLGGFGGFSDFGFSDSLRVQEIKGREMQLKIKLTLSEIATGVTKKIKVKRLQRCENCQGTGVRPGSSKVKCPVCNGSGEIRRSALGGFFTQVYTCDSCGGTGSVIRDPCPICKGDGRIRGEATVNINIPAGVSSGNYLNLRNQGNAGPNNGPRGDIKVIIIEEENDTFKRDGDDIIYPLAISFSQAALGDTVEIPTLDSEVRLNIPAGTQSGKVLRLAGKGIRHLNSPGAGDQLVVIQVYVPEKLSAKEREIIQELANSENLRPKNQNRDFFQKVKDTFF
jgi:molecular chaperone DnaJ